MKMLHLVLPLALLAACDSSPDVELANASVGEVADAVARADGGGSSTLRMRPGLWETSIAVQELDAPGMPPGIADMMREQFARQTVKACLTQADIDRPSEDFFAGKDQPNCRYENFSMKGGRMEGVMRCAGDQGEGRVTLSMNGTYGENEYKMRQEMVTEMAGRGAMTMKADVSARRVGECTGDEASG